MLLFSVLKTLVQFDDVTAMTWALSTWALTCESQRKAQECVCVRVRIAGAPPPLPFPFFFQA